MEKQKRFACDLSERMGYYKTCLTVRPGSSSVFIGVDVSDRFATLEAMVSPEQARSVAQQLNEYADEVDEEIDHDAASS